MINTGILWFVGVCNIHVARYWVHNNAFGYIKLPSPPQHPLVPNFVVKLPGLPNTDAVILAVRHMHVASFRVIRNVKWL